MKREVKIITHGSIDIEQLSEAEQRAFYATLLARVLELYRKQRERGRNNGTRESKGLF